MPAELTLRRGQRLLAVVAGMALAATANAGDADRPALSLSGFGTLDMVHSGERTADYSSSSMKASGAGYSGAWSPNVDSRLGAQLDARLGRWSAVLQVVSEQNLDGEYSPRVEWANVKYQVTPDLALRAGRIALPLFLMADYRKVGYAYPWVRPPVELYGALPITSSNGADLTWRFALGELRHTTQAFYGSDSRRLTQNIVLDARRTAGLSHTIEAGALTVRLSALTTELTLNVAEDLFQQLEMAGGRGTLLAQRYAVDHKRASLASLGVSYDPGRWFVTAEAGHSHTSSFLGKNSALYAGGGVRLGALTPYLGYSRVRADGSTYEEPPPVVPGRASILANLNDNLNTLLETIPAQSTVSAGLRWDVHNNVALKAQWDRVTPRNGSRGTLINTQPDFVSGHPLDIASLALDFVF
ncbi:MAG: hypothetical protein ACXWC4_23715 [Telluria sp.]